MDLVTDNAILGAGNVSVLLGIKDAHGNGTGRFGLPSDITVGYTPRCVAVGDFNGDGKADISVMTTFYDESRFPQSGIANVLLGNGDGTFSGPKSTYLGRSNVAAVVADINGDAFDDLVTLNRDGNTDYPYVNVLLSDSSGNLRLTTSLFSPGHDVVAVAAGDVNGDAITDLVTGNRYSQNVSVLLGDGTGHFSPAGDYATGSAPAAVILGDFTGDGHIDIATVIRESNSLSVLYGFSNGSFSTAVNFKVGSSPSHLVAGDFDNNGWLDVATINDINGDNDGSVLINDRSWPPPPPPSVCINDVQIIEGNTGSVSATFTVTLSRPFGEDVVVPWTTANGAATAGSDYTAASDSVTIAAGSLSTTVTVQVIGDRIGEPDEYFLVNLGTPSNATITDGQGVGTIRDDEPHISISDVSKYEGNGKKTTLLVFTVTLSTAYDQPVTMSYRTVDGTAMTSDSDYVAKTGTLTFAPGETTKTITIEVKCDNKKEANEMFYLDLFGNSTNSLFIKSRGIGTILNDDK
jgi:hypothetical protein